MQLKLMVVLVVACALILVQGTSSLGLTQQEEESELDAEKIMRKLDEILANQVKILQQFAEIKSELAIIKIRASR